MIKYNHRKEGENHDAHVWNPKARKGRKNKHRPNADSRTKTSKENVQRIRRRKSVNLLFIPSTQSRNILHRKGELTKMIKCYIMDTDGNEKIGQHFKVKEFACKDGSPVVFIDDYLCNILDILRNKLGKPVIINSGYRTPELLVYYHILPQLSFLLGIQ